jgi:hypothetical protein
MTRSNLVGCSTGRSAGFTPLKILCQFPRIIGARYRGSKDRPAAAVSSCHTRQSQTASLRMARVGVAPRGLRTSTYALPESHTKIISICSDRASPNSTALIVRGPTPGLREPDDSPCATTRGRTYRQSSRAGGRASTNMVEVLNPTVREPWQKLKEYFMN